jgi:hypothetical protein
MSLHISVVCFQGARQEDIEELLGRMEYRLVEPPRQAKTTAELQRLLWVNTGSRNRVVKATYSDNGWTYLLDPEMVVMCLGDVLSQYSREKHTRIFAWVCEGASMTYGFRVFDHDSSREFIVQEGSVVADKGQPIIEEMDLDWTRAVEAIMCLAAKLGAPYDYLEHDRTYLMYTLDE